MEIIEKGTKPLPEEIVYIKKCEVCGCKFTYVIEDIISINFLEDNNVLRCPQCKYWISVPFIKKKYKSIIDKNS